MFNLNCNLEGSACVSAGSVWRDQGLPTPTKSELDIYHMVVLMECFFEVVWSGLVLQQVKADAEGLAKKLEALEAYKRSLFNYQ